jgi:hypothetical protein
MDPRRTKQLIYGGAFLVIVIFIAWGIYSLVKPASPCAGLTSETAATECGCGGPCTPTNLQPLTVGANGVWAFQSTPGHYTFLVQVADLNVGYGAQNFGFSIDLYGGPSSTLVESLPGRSFIYPGQVKYLVAPNISVSSAFTSSTIVITPPTWASSSTMGNPPQFNDNHELPVTGVTITSSTVIVASSLTDSDVSAFNNIFVVAVFKDSNGNVIGASQTQLDSIAPNQTETFSVSYPVTPNLDPALTEIDAYALR